MAASSRVGFSLELRDDAPLLHGHVRPGSRFGVLPPPILLARHGFPHDPALDGHRADDLRHMLVPLDPTDLREQAELLLQSLPVSHSMPLAIRQHAQLLVTLGLPDPNVRVFGARENEATVRREAATQNTLHPLRVVDVPRALRVVFPEPHGLVITGADKVLSRCVEVYVKHWPDVIPMSLPRCIQSPHVEAVEVAILIGNDKARWSHRIPGHRVGPHGQDHLPNGGVPPKVEKGD
mmetsp:Transcript_40877/g.89467  ORF Transcript_40877/g.89467 Transcript_40877/m.89467 type:complete len:236 (+) Transcript_40877:58-765(+)